MLVLPAPEDWYALPEIEVQEGEPIVVLVLKLGMMIAFDDRREESEREADEREREGQTDSREELLPTATIQTSTGPKLVRLPRELVQWAFARHRSWEFGWERRFPSDVLFNRIDGKVEATVIDEP
jgi:hypothetical protein